MTAPHIFDDVPRSITTSPGGQIMTEASETQSGEPKRTTPETLRLRAVAPALTVDDLEASLAWYRDVVGFAVEETWEREGTLMGASLMAGAVRFHIGQDDWAKGRDRTKGDGFRLHLTTAQDVDELAAAIKERGGALDAEPADMPWGVRAFSVVDPDGFRLTISSEA